MRAPTDPRHRGKRGMAALVLGALCLWGPAAQAQDGAACRIVDACLEDQFLRVKIEDLRIRDTYVNLALRYTNLDPEDVVITKYGVHLVAVSQSNERIELSANRIQLYIGQGDQRRDAYSLKFNQPVGEEIDLILIFENPDSRYAFLGLRQGDFTGAPGT